MFRIGFFCLESVHIIWGALASCNYYSQQVGSGSDHAAAHSGRISPPIFGAGNPRVMASAFAAQVAEASYGTPAVSASVGELIIDVYSWDGSAFGIRRSHPVGIAVGVGFVAEAACGCHAVVLIPIIVRSADVSKFVFGGVDALINDLVGEVLVMGLVALGALPFALLEGLSGSVNNEVTWNICFFLCHRVVG